MYLAFFLLALLGPLRAAGTDPPQTELSSSMAAQRGRAQEQLERTASGRRLLAEGSGKSWRQAPGSGTPLRYRHGPPGELVADPRPWGALRSEEKALVLARELSRAAADSAVQTPEGEAAAYQAELEFALELARLEPAFASRLRSAYDLARDKAKAHRVWTLARRARLGWGQEPPIPRPPQDEVLRAGHFLYLFSQDPDEFYYSVEWGLSYGPDIVGLSELSDFMERHEAELSALKLGPDARYARIGARRYPAALARAALVLADAEGLERLREALGPFDAARAGELKTKADRWLRGE